ncbi:cold shock domain-containing protein [Marivita sp. GX14005]|uniref:cold-shock protein n=1 Tax=Marivita sp. GX14005 TaxID=2942276 RepID=UPI00201963ED|nr:cold shock domain-containing protein [Marivita sp. GX14005]MCL3883558.1 cold shock domain-containing protein [Marivita sp. GX14005]
MLDTTVEHSPKADARVSGYVKWFDPAKGFGFLVSDEGGPDILLHANVLRNFGQGSVADNARIVVDVQKTARGLQAIEIIEITPPAQGDVAPLEDFSGVSAEEIAATPLEPARVKWFDKAKGFGFANVYGRPEDVFIHIEVLRRSGLSDLFPGEALALRAIQSKRGRMAVEVLAWEAGLD